MAYNVIDLFSGAGGLTEGFQKEGFNILAHIEKEYWACETLGTRIAYYWLKDNNRLDLYFDYLRATCSIKQNLVLKEQMLYHKYPDLKHHVQERMINKSFGISAENTSNITSQDAINIINGILTRNKIQDVSLVIGGPPCQAYSLIGRGRMREQAAVDERNYLFRYYLDIVNEFKPELFVFENVPGLLTAHDGGIFPAIKEEFDSIGYGLSSGRTDADKSNIIDCKDFGVYQTRRRLVLIGYRKDCYPKGFVYPDFKKYCDTITEQMTTENVLSDLPLLHVDSGSDFWFGDYPDKEDLSQFQVCMREDSPGVLNHRARAHRPEDLKIYKIQIQAAVKGGQVAYSDLPDELQFHENKAKKVFEDRFRVHAWNQMPHTIVAHISKDGHYNIHPSEEQLRSLTVREAARIQTFPDNYFFEGPRTSQFLQVGNAVPPLLANVIAKAVKEELRKPQIEQQND